MAELDRMIAETRQWRVEHHNERRCIEAAACAIREKALLDARRAILGRIDRGYEFRSVLKGA